MKNGSKIKWGYALIAVATVFALTMPASAEQSASQVKFLTYEPGLIQESLDSGKTVFVDYTASWCPTCKKTGRIINSLRTENPDYDESIIFVAVDWDDFKNHEVTTSRNIPRHSTLIILKGTEEVGSVLAGSKAQIRELLDLGLQAAS